jgi:hypothetical protein
MFKRAVGASGLIARNCVIVAALASAALLALECSPAEAAPNPDLNGCWQLYRDTGPFNDAWSIGSGTSTTINGFADSSSVAFGGGPGCAGANGHLDGSISNGSGKVEESYSDGSGVAYVITSASSSTMTGFLYYYAGFGHGAAPPPPSSFGDCEQQQQANQNNPNSGWYCQQITWRNVTPPPTSSLSSISGKVTARLCTVAGCKPEAPPSPEMVIAQNGGGTSRSAVTGRDGSYTINSLDAGTWRVTPHGSKTEVFTPASKTVTFNSGVAGLQSGVDFTVCDDALPSAAKDSCQPEFDYVMPPRYDDARLTKKYASPSDFTVLMTIRHGECDASARYKWFVDGKSVKSKPTAEKCVFKVNFDDVGTYRVRVDQSRVGPRDLSFTRKVVVQDFVVAALGDSLASGEGAPPYTSHQCDTSKLAYGSQAALKLETADPKSSVTFLHLACSGATIDKPVSSSPFGGTTMIDQIRELHSLTAKGGLLSKHGRQIDALTMSAGINDVGFASLVATCVAVKRCQDLSIQGTSIPAEIDRAINNLPALYDKLHAEIKDLFKSKRLKPGDIYIIGYPDPLQEATGRLCPVMIPNGASSSSPAGGGFENVGGAHEVSWVENHLIEPLKQAEQRAASQFGWHFINLDGHGSAFASHGYCSTDSWFNHIGAFVNKKVNYSGILHPTAAGQTAIADPLTQLFHAHLLPAGHARPPS